MAVPKVIRQLEKVFQQKFQQLGDPSRYVSRTDLAYKVNSAQQITELYLRNASITDFKLIAPLFSQLDHLSLLALSGNPIKNLNPLKDLPTLKQLELINTGVTHIGVLKELPNLTYLVLRNNTNIKDWVSLHALTGLTSLDIQGSSLSGVAGLEHLQNLKNLELGGNKIEDLSPLQYLEHLEDVNFSSNQVTSIEFARKLYNLNSLWFYNNKVKDLSPVKGLTRLRALGTGKNLITDFTPIEGLTGLTRLQIIENKLQNIYFVKDLTNLVYLTADDNQIKNLEPLQHLKKLQTATFENNSISKLPEFCLDLNIDFRWTKYGTEGFNLFNNPMIDPPPEIIKQGRPAVEKWLKEESIYVNEVKVLLVGHGEVGKTTLVKSLIGEKPDPKEPSTHYIRISKHLIDYKGQEVKLNFWDFGGQEVMHSTHQFFLSSRSLYLLLLDGRRDEDPEYWLKHIESFGGNSPVLVVLNKVDTNPSYDVDRRFLQQKYPFIQGFYKTACFNKIQGIDELRDAIRQALSHVGILSSPWPKSWLPVKNTLEGMKKSFISQPQYERLCKRSGITDEISKETLASYLNDLGIIVHFKDLRLSNLHILQPRWASRAAYKIINSEKIARNHGLFEVGWLTEIMKKADKSDFNYAEDIFPYILDLMQKFELCFAVTEAKQYLIPELMDIQQPVLPLHEGSVLKFVLKFEDLLPRSIIARFIVRMHEDIKGNLRWRTGAVLSVPIFESLAIVIADVKERKITITVSGKRRREHFAIIRKTFHSIKESFNKLNVTEWIPLQDADDFPVEYEELIGHENSQREEIFIGKLGRAYKVADLLNGIEPPTLRKKEFSFTVFLCHSSKDKPVIKKIAADLTHKGISYWFDEEDLDPGDNIIDKITDGLQNSKMIIPCISKDQLASGWCRQEYQSILGRLLGGISKQRIIPLILDDTSLEEMPLFLSGFKSIHYKDAGEYNRLLEYLGKASFIE
ncbi:MAG TPA: COR domain-containing protein [Puia sp.]|nr:COR domain-containing protein [Puia sp.]